MVLRPGLDLRCRSTWCTECGDSLFHHVNESGELSRFDLGNRSHCQCRGACVIESEGKGCGTMQYKPCSVMDLLQCIWIIVEMVRELELGRWATLAKSFCGKPQVKAQLCSAVEIQFFTIRKVVSDKLPVVLPQISKQQDS